MDSIVPENDSSFNLADSGTASRPKGGKLVGRE
jgi:hypothetical protein